MTAPGSDVLAIGNAIVDVLAHETDSFLETQGMHKGSMQLIDAERAERLYAAMPPGIEASGGSAANTVAGLAGLGGRGAFIGKVADDQLGRIFTHDLRAGGVRYDTAPLPGGAPTGRCLILVTPDAQRTMNTYLGAGVELGPEDIAPEAVQDAAVLYLEGYLWDPPRAKEAFVKAADIARAAGRKVALTLSDKFCVDRYREEFRALVQERVDILFANELELMALYEEEDFDKALAALRGRVPVAAVTRSEKGSVLLQDGGQEAVAAAPVGEVVDTTGAGDLYAAGFLFGFTRGYPLRRCGEIGSLAAAEVIGHMGPRPQAPLAALLADRFGES